MQKQKEKKEILYTPVGIAVWPALNKPEAKFVNEKNPYPVWKTGIKLKKSEPEVQTFLADLKDRYDAVVAEAEANETPKEKAARLKSKNPEIGMDLPWKDELDEQGEETGHVILNLKQAAHAKRKSDGQVFDFFVDLVDAKGARIDRDKVRIGGGSTIVCAFEVGTFITQLGAGLSLRLKAVQVLERVEYQGREYSGFQKRDGFSVEELAQTGGVDAGDEEPTGSATDDSI